MENHFDVIVIGAGAAGLTAGIYLSRAKVKTLILNEGAVGGQMVLTHEIANYPWNREYQRIRACKKYEITGAKIRQYN